MGDGSLDNLLKMYYFKKNLTVSQIPVNYYAYFSCQNICDS